MNLGYCSCAPTQQLDRCPVHVPSFLEGYIHPPDLDRAISPPGEVNIDPSTIFPFETSSLDLWEDEIFNPDYAPPVPPRPTSPEIDFVGPNINPIPAMADSGFQRANSVNNPEASHTVNVPLGEYPNVHCGQPPPEDWNSWDLMHVQRQQSHPPIAPRLPLDTSRNPIPNLSPQPTLPTRSMDPARFYPEHHVPMPGPSSPINPPVGNPPRPRSEDFSPKPCPNISPNITPDDQKLVEMKQKGMTYREVKQSGLFGAAAESTLRGRYRTATKPASERLRNPPWNELDKALLDEAVCQIFGISLNEKPTGPLVSKESAPWQKVSNYIREHGGSYSFSIGACKKMWEGAHGISSPAKKRNKPTNKPGQAPSPDMSESTVE